MTSVLVIDDSASARRATTMLLAGSSLFHRVLEAPDGLAGLRIAVAEKPDLVVCDLEMPLCDGARFLALKQSRPELANVPVLMVTGETDPERKATLFAAGAADYVTKPFHPRELLARVQVHLRLKLLREELLEKNRHLSELSTTDGLTGLKNRRCFDFSLEAEVTRARRYDVPLSLVILDLDHFKQVNDTHGHPVGDRVLAGVAKVMRDLVRSSDVAARYGGEELALILPHTGLSSAAVLADRLRVAVEHATFGDTGVHVTASLGLACLADLVDKSPAGLITAADAALYAAKSGGRNCIHFGARLKTGTFPRQEMQTSRFRRPGT